MNVRTTGRPCHRPAPALREASVDRCVPKAMLMLSIRKSVYLKKHRTSRLNVTAIVSHRFFLPVSCIFRTQNQLTAVM